MSKKSVHLGSYSRSYTPKAC